MTEFHLDEYGLETERKLGFWGANLRECAREFEQAKVFDGLAIYEAEQETEVLFGQSPMEKLPASVLSLRPGAFYT